MKKQSKINTRQGLMVLPGKRSVGDRTSEKKRLRRQIILHTILTEGPISRAEIARRLEFNPQTVKLVIPELIEEGLIIEEQEEPQGQMGRPASPCRVNEKAAMIFGLSDRPGLFEAVALDLSGDVIASHEEESPTFQNPAARASWIADAAMRFYDSISKKKPLAGAALALDEPVPTERETYPGINVPVAGSAAYLMRRDLENKLGVTTLVDQSSRMLALGSRWFGASQNTNDFLFLDLSETFRVSGCINGRVLHGATGFAGEIGSSPVAAVAEGSFNMPTGRLLNEFLGLDGFQALAKEMGMKGDAASLAAKAAGNDYKAKDLWNAYAKNLSVPITLLVNLFNPQAIVIGGKMAAHGDAFFNQVQEHLFEMLPQDVLTLTELLVDKASAEPKAVAIGAAATVFDHMFSTSYAEILDVV